MLPDTRRQRFETGRAQQQSGRQFLHGTEQGERTTRGDARQGDGNRDAPQCGHARRAERAGNVLEHRRGLFDGVAHRTDDERQEDDHLPEDEQRHLLVQRTHEVDAEIDDGECDDDARQRVREVHARLGGAGEAAGEAGDRDADGQREQHGGESGGDADAERVTNGERDVAPIGDGSSTGHPRHDADDRHADRHGDDDTRPCQSGDAQRAR